VGEARRNALLKHFKTIKAIEAATYEELAAVVPKNTAKRSTSTITSLSPPGSGS
jgi:excinuclease UvrABC nuclease subunit